MDLASDSKAEKEAFVSGLEGTSYWEVSLLTSYGVILLGIRAFLITVLPNSLLHSKLARFVIEWIVTIFPIILIATSLSNQVTSVYFTTLVIMVFGILALPSVNEKEADKEQFVNVANLGQSTTEDILRENNEMYNDEEITQENDNRPASIFTSTIISRNHVPFITGFRGLTMIISCIAILAVDFHVFPRRFAKTEVYGTGLMDTGVGLFVVSNAIVSPEARGKYRYSRTFMDKIENLTRNILSSWPLWTVGLCRIVFVKLAGYQEHVSEYGVHWNFFFTIAVVKIVATFVLSFVDIAYCFPLSLFCIILYQYFLSYSPINLTSIILNEDRNGFMMANKEGLCSCIGFLSLYFAAVQIGVFLFQGNRTNIVSWFIICMKFLLLDIVLWVLTMLVSEYVQPVSRRFANLAFVLWISALCFQFLVMSLLFDFFYIVCINWNKLSADSMPEQWILIKKKNAKNSKVRYDPPTPPLCLISAVNRNQFLFFMTSNICTGLINLLFNTMNMSDKYSLNIVSIYTFINLLFVWILHVKQVSLKFW